MNNQAAYFSIQSHFQADDAEVFDVRLNPDYCVYAGHFPQRAIAPGVCQIEMIRQCTEVAVGKQLFIRYIKQCRFLSLITPQDNPLLRVKLEITLARDVYSVRAEISGKENTPLVTCTTQMTIQTTD